jgi:hypothetical protein
LKKLIGILAVLVALIGCDQQTNMSNQPVGLSKRTWIQLTDKPNYNGFFVLTTDPVKAVGKQLGYICPTCNGPSAISNTLVSGTKLYEIQGQSVKNEFAVETSKGHYFKAVWYGLKRP